MRTARAERVDETQEVLGARSHGRPPPGILVPALTNELAESRDACGQLQRGTLAERCELGGHGHAGVLGEDSPPRGQFPQQEAERVGVCGLVVPDGDLPFGALDHLGGRTRAKLAVFVSTRVLSLELGLGLVQGPG